MRTLDEYGLGTRWTNACVAYLVYLKQTVWPADLAPYEERLRYELETLGCRLSPPPPECSGGGSTRGTRPT